ncbi:MAG: gamma carbonic anhydrase family protein [Pseudomonadota bacterium]
MAIRHFETHHPQLGEGVYIDEAATVIGQVRFGDLVSVWPGAVIRGDVNWIDIGEQSNVQDGAVLHVSHEGPFKPEGAPLTIGQRVTVGHLAMLHGCTVGDDCLIGMNATLMDDVVVEAGTMVAAGALVTPGKRLESGWLYAGSPAKAIRPLKKNELEFISYSAEHYVALARRYDGKKAD